MRHVGQGIGDLRIAERPPRPVGEAVRLVERVAGDALHQLVIRDRIAIAENHGRHLGVDDRVRDCLGHVPDDFDVLPRGMKHLGNAFRRHQCKQRRKIEPGGQRVDDDSLFGGGHLRDAQQRVIGGLAQEFGIDRDERMLRHPPANRREGIRRGDQIHRAAHLTLSDAVMATPHLQLTLTFLAHAAYG